MDVVKFDFCVWIIKIIMSQIRNPLQTMNLKAKKILLLIIISFVAVFVLFCFPPIAQDVNYHNFADQRCILGLTHFWDIVSNAPFIVVGIIGMLLLITKIKHDSEQIPYYACLTFFFGVFLTGFGSAYYHYEPNNHTLVWDRIPMTIAFMGFLSLIIGEYIDRKGGVYLLLPLLIFGIGSVIYWHLTVQAGADDLRPYAVVQFLPLIIIPLILFLFVPNTIKNMDVVTVMIFYALSKVFEVLDQQMYSLGQIVSGHTIKHLFAGFATYWVLQMFKNKGPWNNS